MVYNDWHYHHIKIMSDGRQAVVMALTFGRARIGIGPENAHWFDDEW